MVCGRCGLLSGVVRRAMLPCCGPWWMVALKLAGSGGRLASGVGLCYPS
uniref:Uncharacterized protein n=1 Tax=Fagus sylvatica TaxID=28930 RepID=A0A2N9G0N7_FAGSY